MNNEPYSETNTGLHYDLQLQIDPTRHYVAVNGSLAYHSPSTRLERARFYLHRQFNITAVSGKRVLGYQFKTPTGPDGEPQASPVPFLPQAALLDVYFDPPLRHNETTLIQFEYQGVLTDWPAESANVIGPDWAELGLYLPWFPLQFLNGPSDLTFTVRVTAPAGFQVSSYGAPILQDGSYAFRWTHPTNDIVVTAGRSQQTRVFESDTNRIFISTSSFSEPAATQLGDDLLWALERYSGWFGPMRPGEFSLIESPRGLGGGYARRGLVVLGGINEQDYLGQREAYLRYLGHEAAHAWWWQAPTTTWEDWLNESFAEFSALLAVRERFGEETYALFLGRKHERAPDFTPVWQFDRSDVSTPEKQSTVERLLYDKGPLLLHDLTERIGTRRFLDLCRGMLWGGVTDTAHLLDLLGELEGAETQQWFEQLLKTA